MWEAILVLIVLLIIVGLVLYALDRIVIPGPTGPLIKTVLIIAVIAIACLYLAQRFLGPA